MPVTHAEITHLFVYPVKSLKGIAVDHAELTSHGLSHDRRFMVVRSNGRFVTQREMSKLALIETCLNGDGIILSRPGKGSISVPFNHFDGQPVSSKVWKDDCEAIDQGEEISRWITQALESEAPLRLVTMNPRFRRSLHQAVHLGSETSTFFADAAPYLVTSQSSLDALNSELGARGLGTVPMNRFRPNVVIKGLEPFAEHRVARITAAHYAFEFRYPCERCVIPTIDQDTGEKDPRMQPYKTLAGINHMPENEKAAAFGENTILKSGEGEQVAIGDKLTVEFTLPA